MLRRPKGGRLNRMEDHVHKLLVYWFGYVGEAQISLGTWRLFVQTPQRGLSAIGHTHPRIQGKRVCKNDQTLGFPDGFEVINYLFTVRLRELVVSRFTVRLNTRHKTAHVREFIVESWIFRGVLYDL